MLILGSLIAAWFSNTAHAQDESLLIRVHVDEGCGGLEQAESLANELRAREVNAAINVTPTRPTVFHDSKADTGWWVLWVYLGTGRCYLDMRRNDIAVRLEPVEAAARSATAEAAVQVLWVLDAYGDRTSMPMGAPILQPTIPRKQTTRAELAIAATASLSAVNGHVTAFLGGEVALVRIRQIKLFVAAETTVPKQTSRFVYQDFNDNTDSPSLGAFGLAAGAAWRLRLSDHANLRVPLRIGFFRARENFSNTLFPDQPAQRSFGLWTEAHVGIEGVWSGARLGIEAGYRFVGPLKPIGPDELGFSAPSVRIVVGYGQ